VTLSLTVAVERWPLAGAFTISRGSKTEAVVVVATLSDGVHQGRGECVPYARYGETVEGVADLVRAMAPALAAGLDRAGLQLAMKAGAARNALDCAFFDLEAKRAGRRVTDLIGVAPLAPVVTAYTLSLDTPEAMGRVAAENAARPLLKIKLGGLGDIERLRAIRAGAPNADLIIDANEGWRAGNLAENLVACAEVGVSLVEQPLPAGDDEALRGLRRPILVCADESVHDRASLAGLVGKYDAVNIKLDKTGGLTEALAMRAEAEKLGFALMVGCMLGTSLAMAPALVLAQGARVVDLDGPLLMKADRPEGLTFQGSTILPPEPALWG
jgi:L-alanine-DL-glutamate epimerase-like enolase superfamily enzyme